MAETGIRHFGPFHLDVGAARLWRGTEAVRLTAKAWGVLRHLVIQAGQLVTKEELFATVWDAAYVSDAALAVCIRALRQALGDTAPGAGGRRPAQSTVGAGTTFTITLPLVGP